MLFNSIKHGVFISLHLFHPISNYIKRKKQYSNNPRRSEIKLPLKVWEGLVGGGRGMEEEKRCHSKQTSQKISNQLQSI